MKLTARVTRKIEDIPQEDWDKVFPDTLEGYNFLRSLDESKFDQFSFYYIAVYDGDEIVGAAPCFLLNYSLDTSISGSTRRIFNLIKKAFPDFLSIKALVCGMPMGKGQIGMARQDRRIVKAILHKMEEVAKHEKARIVAFKDFSHGYKDTLGFLLKKRFFKVDGLPYAEMDLDFKDFDDYLKKRLSGRSRYDLKRKFRKVDADVDIKMEIVDSPTDEDLKRIYELYMAMVAKHEMGFEIVPPEFFKAVPKHMPGQTKFFLWKVDDKVVAFLFCLLSGDVMIDYYLGLDYSVAHKYHLFFIKHRDMMKWCIEKGIKRYEIGISGYEPKKRLGFDFTPLDIYAKHRSRVMNPLFKILTRFLKFENFDPDLKEAIRSMREKGQVSHPKSVRTTHPERRAGKHSPDLHEEGALSGRD